MRHVLLLMLMLSVAVPAEAARTRISGFDTCDVASTSNEFATSKECSGGANAGVACTVDSECPSSTCVSVGNVVGSVAVTTDKRTGRCGAVATALSGTASYLETDLKPSDKDVYARVYAWAPSGLPTNERFIFGMMQGATNTYGCGVTLSTNGTLRLRFKDLTTYPLLGETAPGTFTATTGATAHALELRQQNTTASCSGTPGACAIICSLWLDGYKVLETAYGEIHTVDYGAVSNINIGLLGTDNGAGVVAYDDLVLDDAVQIGVGSVAPLYPASPDGTQTEWSNTCSGSHWNCLAAFTGAAPAIDDGDSNFQYTATSNRQEDVNLTSATQPTGGTIEAVRVFGVSRETAANSGAFRLNLLSSGTITGTSYNPPSTTYAIGTAGQAFSTTKPAGGAWTQAALDALQVQLDTTATGSVRITDILGYADLKSPVPAAPQNLQDWDGDGRLTLAFLGDSITQGTGIGYCQQDATAGLSSGGLGAAVPGQCSFNAECFVCANSRNTACTTLGGDCGGGLGTCTDYGPCANTGKIPSVFNSLNRQVNTGATTILNYGINGNRTDDMLDRLPGILSGVGQVAQRYCLGGPTPGTPNKACSCTSGSGLVCFSTDCYPNWQCSLSGTLASGSAVCSNSHATTCTANADCSGGGTCTDYPGADYVVTLAGWNDLVQAGDFQCESGALSASCPPVALPTPPAPTPISTPGFYGCPRVACANNADCVTALGTGSSCRKTCSATKTKQCNPYNAAVELNLGCPSGETCGTPYACSCPCAAVHCTQDSDCGPGYLDGGRAGSVAQYGTCVANRCTSCGPPACKGTTQYTAWHRARNPHERFAVRTKLRDTVLASGRRPVDLTMAWGSQACATYGDVYEDALRQRELILEESPNAVDIWRIEQHADAKHANLRCSYDAGRLCSTSADCPLTRACVGGSNAKAACAADSACPGGVCSTTCVTYPSILRGHTDPIHANSLGAGVIGTAVNDYLTQFSPVCSDDLTTGCGRCSVGGAACIKSSDCASWETNGSKCLATTSVCSGAGKGTCTRERACNATSDCVLHHRCTLDLTVVCDEDSDCTGNGLCRPEGLLAPGEG